MFVSHQLITVLSEELTMLWEEHCEKANERKSFKYTGLMVDWRIEDCANLAVSCWGRLQRGLQLQSVWKLLTRVEISQRIILDMTLWRRSVLEVVVHRLQWIGHHCWGSNGSGSKDHLMTIGTDRKGGAVHLEQQLYIRMPKNSTKVAFFHPSKVFWKI